MHYGLSNAMAAPHEPGMSAQWLLEGRCRDLKCLLSHLRYHVAMPFKVPGGKIHDQNCEFWWGFIDPLDQNEQYHTPLECKI